MKLKRYVLLEDNGVINTKGKLIGIDVEKYGFNTYDSDELYWFDGIFSFPKGKITATSDEATDLIRENDLIEIKLNDENLDNFYTRQVVYTVVNDIRCNILGVENDKGWFRHISSLGENILAIFKLIGKDYICVWEKENK